MKQVLSNKKIIVILVCFVAVIILFLLGKDGENNDEKNDILALEQENGDTAIPIELMNEEQTKEEGEVKSGPIYIDLKGAVLKPGVYMVEENSRVQDVIQLAGGFLENADQTKINLAARVEDEMVVYVPKMGEEGAIDSGGPSATQINDGKVNINNATSEQLQGLPGIGPAKAEKILSYRETNGPFKTVEDLVNVSGIGEKSFEQLKDMVKVR